MTDSAETDLPVVSGEGSFSEGRTDPLADWLLHDGWNIADPLTLVVSLANRILGQGTSLMRMSVFLRSLHPQVVGVRYLWSRQYPQGEARPVLHADVETPTYRESPLIALTESRVGMIRRRLNVRTSQPGYPMLDEFRAAGGTDYLAVPMGFSSHEVSAAGFVTDCPRGFSDEEIERLQRLTTLLARPLELHSLRYKAATLLDTYMGRQTGERVLKGLIKRGDGEDIHAAIWFSDLRDSTRMADSMPRGEFIGVLNEFFECMAGAVLDHGGEVLRYVGDSVLAIFQSGTSSSGLRRGCCEESASCSSAIDAARDARNRIDALNRRRREAGAESLRYGLALHMGDVTYGNIGVPGRLEFTVVGPAANEAARLEGLCKQLNQPLLISDEFRRCLSEPMISLGVHSLGGVSAPREVYTLPLSD